MGVAERLEAALGDRYRIQRELGEGGMATVFLAEDLKHQRHVAIKVLKPELSAILGGERFLREIGIAAKLQHPHILPLFDSGQVDGLLYYVMPFVEGESVRDRLTREQQLPVADALQIAREVGDALQYAHGDGVVHRDIKPENIMLSAGHAVVADFGIARALGAAGADHLTHTGMAIGTAAYMSPEQAGAMPVDGRSDEYSLACTLYEMLIGEPPFTGPSPQAVMARHTLEPVPSLRVVRQTVPQEVEDAIIQAMAKVPADRFPSVQHFVDALAQAGPTASGHPSSGRMRVGGPPRVRKPVVIALAGVGVLLLAVLAWLLLRPVGGGPAGASTINAVAVLPFVVSEDTSAAYLADGMTEGLIADLAQIGSLKVLSRSSTALAEGSGKSLAQVAQDLGVDAVVKGTILRSSDTVRVNVRLHAADGTALWTKDYQGRLADLPDLQRQITIAISGEINAKLEPEAQKRLGAGPKVDQQAYEAYLRGRFHLEREELEQARALFERARQIAPGWAPPYVGLANYYTALPFYSDVPPVDVLPKARAMLVDALDRDETLAEAHAGIAYIRA
jgi:TolB-like protein